MAILLAPVLAAGLALAPAGKQAFLQRAEPAFRERAALRLEDDFSAGLSGWRGGAEWASGWRSDAAGMVRPGKLALLTASLPLSDYEFRLVGQIDRRSLGWVFRASDLRNYYAVRVTIARPGPLPLAVLVREVVVNGVRVEHVELPLPLSIRNDTVYRVTTVARHDQFTISVNGRLVDAFHDGRHPAGGVGLFSEPGEAGRVFRVRVSHNDDLLGRICAYLSGDSADISKGEPALRKDSSWANKSASRGR